MMKKILIIMFVSILVACGESKNSASNENDNSSDNSSGSDGSSGSTDSALQAQLDLVNQIDLIKHSNIQVQANIRGLLSDDAIYIHVESTEIGTGKLRVEPKDSMIYPANKAAHLYLLFSDNGIVNPASVTVKVVTSTGQIIERQLKVKVGE